MNPPTIIRPNSLGDLRAEADNEMLNKAFLETADYRTLIESSDRTVIIGRRGTGKSALTMKLDRLWNQNPSVSVLKIAPEEYQTIALRPKVALFGDSYNMIRAGSKLVWMYALMMEIALVFSNNYQVKNSKEIKFLESRINGWSKRTRNSLDNIAYMLDELIDPDHSPESRIASLPVSLDLTNVEENIKEAGVTSKAQIILLVDRLDEGYEPDTKGTALIAGLIHAAQDLKTRLPFFKPLIFLRDNIFRAVENFDSDFSRNIEGSVLRLHWDENALWSFATNRLKVAFDIGHENSERIWNACTSSDLTGKQGLKTCLSNTLYRPRDLLSLLNEAFYRAGRNGVSKISHSHIKQTSREISRNRLKDLNKEYQGIFPSLTSFTSAFRSLDPELSMVEAVSVLEGVMAQGSDDPVVQQDYDILEKAENALDILYSVGFLGVSAPTEERFVFCHDGRTRDREFLSTQRILIHPCYWIALNCTKKSLDQDQAEDIFDEYDIEVSSETPEIRNKKIEELMSELDNIEKGVSEANRFELWCVRALRICFAKGLENIELHPNPQAKQRRDIVATNLSNGTAWKRVYEDYESRQVLFEVKNTDTLQSEDYQQLVANLGGPYGRLAFMITRESKVELYKGKDIEWVRSVYADHSKLIIKITGVFLRKLLGKLRNPQKHDAVNNSINSLLKTYTSLYIGGQNSTKK